MASTPNIEASKEVPCVDVEKQPSTRTSEEVPNVDFEKQPSEPPTKPAEEPEPEYPKGMKLASIMLSILVSMFLVALVGNGLLVQRFVYATNRQ